MGVNCEPYDGYTLREALDQIERLTGIRPNDTDVDLDYRGQGETKSNVYIAIILI